MEKRNRVTQFYGYAICLVAIITFIICLAALVGTLINLSDPMQSRSSYTRAQGPSLASFDNYKMDIKISLKEGQQMPDDETLKSMYEAARTDIIQGVQFRARRDVIVDSLIILVCIILFITHWVWMRRLSRAERE